MASLKRTRPKLLTFWIKYRTITYHFLTNFRRKSLLQKKIISQTKLSSRPILPSFNVNIQNIGNDKEEGVSKLLIIPYPLLKL